MAGTGPPNLNLHIYNPRKSRKEASQHIKDDVWLLHQQRIVDLYINQDLRLKDVIDQMSEFEGFDASKMQYKKKLHEWNVQKYSKFSPKQVKYMVQKMLYRHLDGKEKTGFRRNGEVLDWFRTKRTLRDAVKKGNVDVPSLLTDYPPLSPGELSPFTPEGHGCEFQELQAKFWPRFSPTSSRRALSRSNSGMTNVSSSTSTTTTTARQRRYSVASDSSGMQAPSRRSTGFSQSSRSSQQMEGIRIATKAPARQNTATSIMSVMQQIPENVQAVPPRQHHNTHHNHHNHHHHPHNRITNTHHSSEIYLPGQQPPPTHLPQTCSCSAPSLPLANRFASLRQDFQRYLNISHPHGDLLSVNIFADQGPRAVRIRISCQDCNFYGNKIAFIPPGTTSSTNLEAAITSSFHILTNEFTQDHILTPDHRALVDARVFGSSNPHAHAISTMTQAIGNLGTYSCDDKFDFDYDPKDLSLLKTDTGFQSYVSGYSDNDGVYSATSFVSSPVSMKMPANDINWEEWTRNIEESSYLA